MRPPSRRKPPNVSVYAVTIHCWVAAVIFRSAETAGSAMFTIVASRITIRTVTAMTASASHRLAYGSVPGVVSPAVVVGAVSLKASLNRSFVPVGRVVGREGNVAGCDDGVVPVSVVFISDTHMPKRARDLPVSLWDRIVTSDVVVHAGDWVDVA